MSKLALPKGKRVAKPVRDPDMISKRGVPYWFSPEWVRATDRSQRNMGRIKAVRKGEDNVSLYMLSKDGNLTYIQGSIQVEFKDWCTDREIDSILLGIDMDEILLTDWEYE